MKMIRSSLLSLALVGAGLVAAPAFAGSVTGSLDATATVANSCSISSVTAIAFGTYDPAVANASSPLDAAGAINVLCTKGGAFQVQLDQGANADAASTCLAPVRQLKDANGDLIKYDIYSDTGRATAWACDVSNQVAQTSASASAPTNLATYGRIPPAQDVPAGSYSDTVTITVSF